MLYELQFNKECVAEFVTSFLNVANVSYEYDSEECDTYDVYVDLDTIQELQLLEAFLKVNKVKYILTNLTEQRRKTRIKRKRKIPLPDDQLHAEHWQGEPVPVKEEPVLRDNYFAVPDHGYFSLTQILCWYHVSEAEWERTAERPKRLEVSITLVNGDEVNLFDEYAKKFLQQVGY